MQACGRGHGRARNPGFNPYTRVCVSPPPRVVQDFPSLVSLPFTRHHGSYCSLYVLRLPSCPPPPPTPLLLPYPPPPQARRRSTRRCVWTPPPPWPTCATIYTSSWVSEWCPPAPGAVIMSHVQRCARACRASRSRSQDGVSCAPLRVHHFSRCRLLPSHCCLLPPPTSGG